MPSKTPVTDAVLRSLTVKDLTVITPPIDRRTFSRASRKALFRLAKFWNIVPSCTCKECLVEVLARKLP